MKNPDKFDRMAAKWLTNQNNHFINWFNDVKSLARLLRSVDRRARKEERWLNPLNSKETR